MANVAIFVSAVITFFIPFLIGFVILYSAALKKKKGRGTSFRLSGWHSRPQTAEPYDPASNTADYPTACQASYNPQRAKDQLDTLLRAGHLTREEYQQRMEQLKNYKHC